MRHDCPHLDVWACRREHGFVERRWGACLGEAWWCPACEDVIVRLHWPPADNNPANVGWVSAKADKAGERMRFVAELVEHP